MAQLMGGILVRIKSCREHMFFYKSMYRRHADAVIIPRTKQRAVVRKNFFVAFGHIIINSGLTSAAEIDDPFFISFACNSYSILINVA